MPDLVQRLIASSCSENCLMGKAAKEITRLRKIESERDALQKHLDRICRTGYVVAVQECRKEE